MSAMFSSLAVRNYRVWFAGALVSNTGLWMQRIAQDWLVLTELTANDATAVGITTALNFGPQLLLLPITGYIADRFDRRLVLTLTQIAMGLLALGLGILTLTGVVELWMVYCFAGGLGIVSAIDAPVRQAFVSELVPPANLGNAVALNATAFNGARLVGPAIAGLLVAAVGSGWVFVINAGTYVAVLGALALLRAAEMTRSAKAGSGAGALGDGVRYVRKRPDIILVMTIVFLMGSFGLNFSIYVATMARIEFGQGAEVFGVLSSLLAIGSLTGSLLAARRERPRLRTIVLALLGFALAMTAGAFAPDVWVFGAVLTLAGMATLTILTTANAYVQTTTRPAMRGRVMALYLAIFLGGTPVGAPVVGWIASAFGPRAAILVGAAAALLAALIAFAFYVRTRDLKLRWEPERRWPLRVRSGKTARDRQLATTEIAIVEAESQRP